MPIPWDPVLPFVASLLLALSFVVMMTALHRAVPEAVRHGTHLGVAFAVMYAVLVSIVYFTVVTVVVPLQQHGEGARVALLEFDDQGSFMQALDGLGYFFLSLSTMCAAFAFGVAGFERWVRRAFLVNGFFGVPILISYMPLAVPWSEAVIPLNALWVLSVPACGVVTAMWFRTGRGTPAGSRRQRTAATRW